MGQSLRAENLIGRHVNIEGVWLERARTAGGGEDGLGGARGTESPGSMSRDPVSIVGQQTF